LLRVNDPFDGWKPPTQQELKQHSREAQEAALEHLGDRVREDAATTPGWEDFDPQVVSHGGETFLGLHPDHEDAQKYFDLEYGTADIAPTGFLRNAVDRHGPEANRVLTAELARRAVWGE
jgi:hypothetical protein